MKKLFALLLTLSLLGLTGCGEKVLPADETQPAETNDSGYVLAPNRVQPVETFGSMPTKYRYGIKIDQYKTGVYLPDSYLGISGFTVQTESHEKLKIDESSSSQIVLTLFTRDDGMKTIEYGSSGHEDLVDAAYIKGVGMVARIWSNSRNGDFYRERENGEEVLVLFGEDLEIKWQRPQNNLGSDKMIVTDKAVYLMRWSGPYEYQSYDLEGNELFCKRFFRGYARLVCNTEKGILIAVGNAENTDEKLYLYDGAKRVGEILYDFSAGRVEAAEFYEDGWVLESGYNAGSFEYYSGLYDDDEAVPWAGQRVLTRYDSKGNALWRGAQKLYFDDGQEVY